MSSPNESRQVKSVQHTCEIIELLYENQNMGVTELAEEIELSKASVHSHLSTLERNKWVVNRDGEYSLSLQYLEWGEAVKSEIDFFDCVKGEVDKLADETGQLIQFATEEHGQVVYLYKSEGDQSVATASKVGSRNPMHCTALGKAMLAYMDKDRVQEIIDRHGLPKMTENTITREEDLWDELSEIRENGYSLNREESHQKLYAIGVPIFEHDTQRILGAISLSGVTKHLKLSRLNGELSDRMVGASNKIEVDIKYS